MLSRAHAKAVCGLFGKNACVFDVSFEKPGRIFNSGTTSIYDSAANRYFEWKSGDGFKFPYIMQTIRSEYGQRRRRNGGVSRNDSQEIEHIR